MQRSKDIMKQQEQQRPLDKRPPKPFETAFDECPYISEVLIFQQETGNKEETRHVEQINPLAQRLWTTAVPHYHQDDTYRLDCRYATIVVSFRISHKSHLYLRQLLYPVYQILCQIN